MFGRLGGLGGRESEDREEAIKKGRQARARARESQRDAIREIDLTGENSEEGSVSWSSVESIQGSGSDFDPGEPHSDCSCGCQESRKDLDLDLEGSGSKEERRGYCRCGGGCLHASEEGRGGQLGPKGNEEE